MRLHRDRKFSNMKDIDMLISRASGVGYGSVAFFYNKKNSLKLKRKLRSNGFFIETFTFASLPNEERITVFWDDDIRKGYEKLTHVDD